MIRQTLIMGTGILLTMGCSLMIDQPNGDIPSERELRSESKSLAGVYTDVDSNGTIKPHAETVGEGGTINGLIILGGPSDMPDIKAGGMKLKTPKETTPSVRMGDTTFSSESSSKGTGPLNKTPEARNK
ncbi:MAG: hypothetical protein H8K03_21615 [Nitrospira sp.]